MSKGITIGVLITLLVALFGYFTYRGFANHLGFGYGIALSAALALTIVIFYFVILVIRINDR